MKYFLILLDKKKTEFFLLTLSQCILFGIEGIAHPLLLKYIFDEGIIKNDFNTFIILIGSYFILGVGLNLFFYRFSLWSKTFENRSEQDMIIAMLNAYFKKKYNYILEKKEGFFINRVYNDVTEGFIPLTVLIRSLAAQVTRVIMLISVLIYLSWKAALLLVILIPIVSISAKRIGQKIKTITQSERDAQGNFLEILSSALSSFRLVRIFGLFHSVGNLCNEKINKYLSHSYSNHRYIKQYETMNSLVMNVSDSLTIFVGTLMVLKKQISFGSYIAFVNTFWRAVTGVMNVIKPFAELKRLLTVNERLFAFLNEEEDKRVENSRSTGNMVILNDVSFSYGCKRVLKDFNLIIEKGKRVLIKGPNGSGKTTLANIISGLLNPDKGNVILPQRISGITLPIMFPPIKVSELLKDQDIINELGIQYLKTRDLRSLSMGEKQKVLVGFTCSQKADLYIFDEPVSNVEQESVLKILNFIWAKTQGKSVVVIMHKEEVYYEKFDQIISLTCKNELCQMTEGFCESD